MECELCTVFIYKNVPVINGNLTTTENFKVGWDSFIKVVFITTS